tara:strand:- start:1812 stop:2225 length:414 start_codon:yes stop_codon:yes gene_type:complete
MNRFEQYGKIQKEALALFLKKNKDYGDAFANYGTVGVLVRMSDKISRFVNVTKSGINLVDNENLRDTLIDLHNYSAMAIMLIDEPSQKPSTKVNLLEPHLSFQCPSENINTRVVADKYKKDSKDSQLEYDYLNERLD